MPIALGQFGFIFFQLILAGNAERHIQITQRIVPIILAVAIAVVDTRQATLSTIAVRS